MKKFLAWTFLIATIAIIALAVVMGLTIMIREAINGNYGAQCVLLMFGTTVGVVLFAAGLMWSLKTVGL